MTSCISSHLSHSKNSNTNITNNININTWRALGTSKGADPIGEIP